MSKRWTKFIDATGFKRFPLMCSAGLALFIVGIALIAMVSWKIVIGALCIFFSLKIDAYVNACVKEEMRNG